jgi:hypothetical protein
MVLKNAGIFDEKSAFLHFYENYLQSLEKLVVVSE